MNCKHYASPNKGKKTVQLSTKLIGNIYEKARTVKKKGELIVTIPCDTKYNYQLNCLITKVKI